MKTTLGNPVKSEANLICADILKNGIERQLKYHLKRVRFSDIPVGACFEFTAARDFPQSGDQLGPWVKTSTRKYTKPSVEYEVESIQSTVFLITAIPNEPRRVEELERHFERHYDDPHCRYDSDGKAYHQC